MFKKKELEQMVRVINVRMENPLTTHNLVDGRLWFQKGHYYLDWHGSRPEFLQITKDGREFNCRVVKHRTSKREMYFYILGFLDGVEELDKKRWDS